MRKLQQLNAATDLAFLRIPPANHLEALKGDRVGQYSIRINDQGVSALNGKMDTLPTLKLLIIIKEAI